MTDHSQNTPMEEFKEKVAEVIELLNQANLPVAISAADEPEVSTSRSAGQGAEVVRRDTAGD